MDHRVLDDWTAVDGLYCFQLGSLVVQMDDQTARTFLYTLFRAYEEAVNDFRW